MEIPDPPTLRLIALPLALALSTGCYHGTDAKAGGPDADDAGGPNGGQDDGDADDDVPEDSSAVGLRPLRRLSVSEYRNTVRDLLGVDVDPSQFLSPDPQGDNGFFEPTLVNEGVADELLRAAEALAAAASERLDTLDDCDELSAGERTCAESFARNFGRRAFRRPLSDDEISELLAVYDHAQQAIELDHPQAMRVVLTAILASPKFLYHWQLPGRPDLDDGEVIKLDGYELAARLSYFLWSTMPDDTLLAAAASGGLDTAAGVSEAVDRMLDDERTRDTVRSFHSQWLALEGIDSVTKDPTLFPEFDPDLRRSMREEIEQFVEHVIEGDARVRTLLTDRTAFVDGRTATLYDLPGVEGDLLQQRELNAQTRGGLLTRAGFIAGLTNPASTNPPRAGHLIFERILCRTVAPPPPGATESFMFDDSQSTRWNYEQLESSEECGGCHRVVNPMGFAFEHYDAIGRYRDTEGPHPIDSSGTFAAASGDQIPFDDLMELSAILAEDDEALTCISNRWWRFALSRMEQDGDQPSIADAYTQFLDSDGDIRMLLGAIAKSNTFRFRAAEPGE